MDIFLIQGDIAQEEADVIVNSTTCGLELNSGPVTQSILEAGGQGLQTECSADYPNGISYDDIAVTDGGDLSCSQVYHLALKDLDDEGGAVETLKELIEHCLTEANDSSYQSIAFPALGTGTLQYPADEVALAFFETISRFGANTEPDSLCTVKIVLNPEQGDLIQTFNDVANDFEDDDNINICNNIHNTSSGSGEEQDLFAALRDLDSEEDEMFFWGDDDDEEEEEDKGEMAITFVEGDITQQHMDVIVNSTTPQLKLSSGPLTKAILTAGGDCLQQECQDNYSGGIGQKDIAITSGGNLPCQYVYHTTSRQWSTSAEQELRELMRIILETADMKGMSTIAVPALGTGKLGYPPDVVAKCLYETVANFSPSSLEEVSFVVRSSDASIVQAFKAEMGNHPQHIDRHASTQGTGFSVSIVKGDIAQQSADVIVNSTTKDLNLSSGPVSQAIVRQGGTTLQKDLRKKYPQGIKSGQIAVSGGGNLQCGHVYHTSLEKWTQDPQVEKSFRDLIILCLTEASNSGMTSIAFPVLGTGVLKYPRDVVAKCVFESFDHFSNNNPNTTLQDVKIVVHPKDVENVKIFEDVNATRAAPRSQSVLSEDHSETESASELVGKVELPGHWAPMADDDFVKVAQLRPSDKEYKKVAAKFTAGVGNGHPVVKIERIQNRTLFSQYVLHKHRMTTLNPEMRVERDLWHGTAYDAISGINVYGFSRSYTGRNATVYGEGCYFAVCPSYSAQDTYSTPNDQGLRHMYLAAVLTGHFTEGSSNMRHPPSRDSARPEILYDTVADDDQNPSIFVVFNDVQAYPRYLVTFQ